MCGCITSSATIRVASWLLLGVVRDSHHFLDFEDFVCIQLDHWSSHRSSFSIQTLYIVKPNFTLDFFFSWNLKYLVLWASVLCSFHPFQLNLWHQRTDRYWKMHPLRVHSAAKGGEKLPQLFFWGQMIVLSLDLCFFLHSSLHSSWTQRENSKTHP